MGKIIINILRLNKLIIIPVILILSVAFSDGYAKTGVEMITVSKGVKNLEPVGVGTTFDSDVNRLYCFTRIQTDEYPTEIVHIWLYNENIIAEVPLEINSNTWRTYSSKQILPKWAGNWKVEVYSADGKLIGETEFTIK